MKMAIFMIVFGLCNAIVQTYCYFKGDLSLQIISYAWIIAIINSWLASIDIRNHIKSENRRRYNKLYDELFH